MNKPFVILCLCLIVSCNPFNEPSFEIDLPEGYQIENSDDKYNLLTASKYIDDEIVGMIEIRYSDDWSFSELSNDEYISEMIETDRFKETSSMMFDNFNIQSKERSYLLGVGDCLSIVYSGDYHTNGVRVTNLVVQFIKKGKLFTLLGSSLPDTFSSNHKTFLKSFDTALYE
jgi:hypothetical protein